MSSLLVTCDTLPAVAWQPQLAAPGGPAGLALFRVQVSANKDLLPGLRPLLLAEELLRASKYHRAADHDRFVLARAALRGLLGRYGGHDPRAIRFGSGRNKKPLALGMPEWHFNVSHAHDWILLAVATAEVGVDVEKVDDHLPLADILQHSFSGPEQDFIGRGAASRPLFYQSWTRKEALAKATAQGIDADFPRLPALDGPHYLSPPLASSGAAWLVRSFLVAPGYPAAVAYPALSPPLPLGFYDLDVGIFGS